jgi:4-hydroxybenzoate polyprenyltransferase
MAWGRLLRLSLAPSAAADVLAGAVVVSAGLPHELGRLALVTLGALCVYHGGMALNDWADRAEDARLRPERPLPRGEIAPASALLAALALLALGPALSALASTRAGGRARPGRAPRGHLRPRGTRGLARSAAPGRLPHGQPRGRDGAGRRGAAAASGLAARAAAVRRLRVLRLARRPARGPRGAAGPRAARLDPGRAARAGAGGRPAADTGGAPQPARSRRARPARGAGAPAAARAEPGQLGRARGVLQSMGMLLRRLLAFTARAGAARGRRAGLARGPG